MAGQDVERSPRPRWNRVLLKLSGEILAGEARSGIDHPTVRALAEQIGEVRGLGCQLAIVVGGGNIFRGTDAARVGMGRA
ncbi:MAG: UMP kinase, partial [Candidatus Eisenbacteria bacterium]|nr:UMP kinase [Candidatus Eisenbacteria bacterium]